jgi:uncharacterized protein with FMN-binding domain
MTRLCGALAILLGLQLSQLNGQDTVEFLNGTTLECKILEIRKEAKEFDIESKLGDKTIKQTYSYSEVHAVQFRGKRFELTPLSNDSSTSNRKNPQRTKAEVLKLIDQAGQSPPDWFSETELGIPDSLDLSWPLQAEPGWNNQKNVGQYIWDIVNPNEHRWRPGIKLVHHVMTLHKGDRSLLNRDMDKLGTMYFTLLQDYDRAAFWFQKAGVDASDPAGAFLAECYWRLGNKAMALDMMKGKTQTIRSIKLLGDMGEIKDALRITEAYAKTQGADEALLAAGDALRKANRLDEAVTYYQRVLDSQTARNAEYEQRYNAMAKGSIESIQLFDKVNIARINAGTYRDTSTGYNGPVEIEVTVTAGKIASLTVTQHTEKQFYAALTDTPKQIIDHQSIREIDGTSGATITSQAIVHATARALAQGAK